MSVWAGLGRSRAFVLAAGVAIAGAPCAADGAPAQRPVPAQQAPSDRELTVVNHGRSIVGELYVSPSTLDQWGDDKLGDDTLEPGKSFKVRLGRVRDCEFDVQAVYEDGSHEESRRVNVCRSRQVTFDGSTAVAATPAMRGDEHLLTLLNNSARPIQQVFISPADASQWGDDRLDTGSISTGDSTKLEYRGDCVADLRVVFDNKAAEERRALNLCQTATLSIEPGWTTADTPPDGATTPPITGTVPKLTNPPGGTVPQPPRSTIPDAPVSARPQKTSVDVVNRSGHPAVELYLAPSGTSDRGYDLLGANESQDGDTLAISVDPSGGCTFTAHVVYGGKTPDGEQRDIDLCGSHQIVLGR